MNELAAILAETAERLLADHASKDVLNAAEEGGWPEHLWAALEENGLTQPLAPEAMGGVGATWADAFVIAFAAGRHTAPAPLAETMAAGWLLSRAGIDAPSGPLGLIDDGHDLTFSADAVSGKAVAVPWGAQAGHAVALIDIDNKPQAVLLAVEDAAADANIAGEPRDTLKFSGATPIASGALNPSNGDAALASPARLAGAVMRAAQIAGAMAGAIEMTVTYAGERRQFGRPIAKFQAIQQMLAIAAAKAAEARMAAECAFLAIDKAGGEPAGAVFEIATAKIVCGEAVETVSDLVHQVHGAIGFTQEHSLHFTTRRLWSWRAEFGAETFWAEQLGRAVLARGAKNLWPDLTAR